MSKNENFLQNVSEKIFEAAVRDELDASQLAEFNAKCDASPKLKEAFEEAVFVRNLFNKTSPQKCPDAVEANILAAIDEEDNVVAIDSRPVSRSSATVPRRRVSSNPVFRLALVASLVFLALWLPNRMSVNNSGNTNLANGEYTEAEILAAAEDMKVAMAMLSKSMTRSSRVLQNEMHKTVRDRIGGSLQRGLQGGLKSTPTSEDVLREDEHSRIDSPPANNRWS